MAAKAAKATVAAAGAGDKKPKEKAQKDKKEADTQFVNTTPKGHKKGEKTPLATCMTAAYVLCRYDPAYGKWL